MEGYEVVGSDEKKFGTVVGTTGENLIVEHGTLRKSRHAVPLAFAHVDDAERVVRVTVPKEIFEDGPAVTNGGQVDEEAVARHYGLSAGYEQPETEGYGETLPDDPGRSAEEEALRTGVTTAVEERAQVRENLNREGQDPSDGPGGSPGRPIIPPDPHR